MIEQKQEKNLSDTIKLFDFDRSTEINKSFLANDDNAKPLDQPKLYLNVVYHDKVLAPLKPSKDIGNPQLADPTDDSTWNIIPISFSVNKERWSGSGMKCIHIDGYVNTCVMEMFKKGAAKIGSLTNYIIERFQNLLKDHYVFHK